MLRSAILAAAITLFAGCQPGGEQAESAVPAATDLVGGASVHTVVAPDGVTIHYDDQGEGGLSLVFVHGWNCDRSYWSGQRGYFAQSHRVVTVDLAGHGDSGQNRADWTMQAFGEDIAAVVNVLDLQKVVLIGHSMGGKVVVEAAGQLGGRVSAVVGVDTFHNGGRETPQARREEVFQEMADDYAGFMKRFVDLTFVEQSDPAIKDFVMADMSAAPYAAAIGARRASGSYGATPAIASLDVPLILISSDFLPTDIAHLDASAKTFRYREMTGVGHFVMLEDPETFNSYLAAALADIT